MRKPNSIIVLLYIFHITSIKIILIKIIIHHTHYEKSDWSRAFNQFTIACELDMVNAISAADIADIADIAFIMSSSTFLRIKYVKNV